MNTVSEIQLFELKHHISGLIDVYIGSASFEPRSLKVTSNLDVSRCVNALIASNVNHSHYNGANLEALISLFSESKANVKQLKLSTDNPVVTADEFRNQLTTLNLPKNPNIVIDITTFTREALSILIAVLRRFMPSPLALTLLYNPALRYGEQTSLWLSKGLKCVRSILGYSGSTIPSKPNHLVVLPGYELERAASLIANYEPNHISIGVVPKTANFTDDFHNQQLQFVNRLRNLYPSDRIECFEFSARSPFVTRDAILAATQSRPECNNVIIPLNSKPSAIGACLACFENSKLQLGYAQPDFYNVENYAIPSEQVSVIKI